MSDAYVLDASALLCLLNAEAGSQTVLGALDDCVIGAVNLSEVASKLMDQGLSEKDVRDLLDPLHLRVLPFDENLAIVAATLRQGTRQSGLSLGDRACLALARARGAVALTADRAWTGLDPSLGVQVQLVR